MNMRAFYALFSAELTYSLHVNTFFEILDSLGILHFNFHMDPDFLYQEWNKTGAEIFNSIVVRIRTKLNSQEFKKKLAARNNNLTRGIKSALNYVDALFCKYARLLVIRIDFHFKKDQIGNTASLEEAQQHFEKFLNNRRSNKVFLTTVGYIWKLHQGTTVGLHYHVLFFLDGSKSHKDEFIASEIGKYWNVVTKGKGRHFNVNRNKERFREHGIGIGMMNHSDIHMRERLTHIVEYFFKKDQILKMGRLKSTRLYGRGEMPKISDTTLGRPRQRSL